MAESANTEIEPVYLELATESEDPTVTQIETLCMNCLEKGTTRLLLTLIPHFHEVMISSFSCPHCNHNNSSLLNTGAVQDRGIKLSLSVRTQADLRRMVVKSDNACVKIPEIELEVPCGTEKGEITTVEGILNKVRDGLAADQDERRSHNPELSEQIDKFLIKLTHLVELRYSFTLEINDPTGNSHIERLGMNGVTDAQLSMRYYERPSKINESLALSNTASNNQEAIIELNSSLEKVSEDDEKKENQSIDETPEINLANPLNASTALSSETSGNASGKRCEDAEEGEDEPEDVRGEVMQFSSLCEECHMPSNTNMKLTDIPHFKEVVIMGTLCSHCGHRTSEVKSGGGIAPKGRRIALTIDDVELDMARDVLKSETCSVEIPALDLHVGAGVLGGKFTTLEGLLINIKDDIARNPFFMGDSVEKSRKDKILSLFDSLDKIMSGDLLTSIVLDDPAGNSYLQNVYAPDPDPNLKVEDYERTFEQNEDLGLNDMKTEGYEET